MTRTWLGSGVLEERRESGGGGEEREGRGREFLGFGGVVVLVFCDFWGSF